MYTRLETAGGLAEHEGKKVELVGRISNTPWQHLIGNPAGYPYSEYFDVDDYQIVIYAKEPLSCATEMIVRGTVYKVQGSSKRPGSKADNSFVEYHLLVDEWECR